MSLRAKLASTVLAILAAGLTASAVGTATLLRSYLLERVDAQLHGTADFATRALTADRTFGTPPGFTPPPGERPPRDTPDVQAARVDASGGVVGTLQGPFSTASDAFDHLPASALASARAGDTVTFETSAPSGRYRGVAQPLPGTNDVTVTVMSLHNVQATISRLYRIEMIGAVIALVTAGALALWLSYRGLRPLEHMADTADAVAAGDVDRRVDVHGNNEVARLGRALNGAFEARNTSEAALRQFISDASHELRNPLTAIIGYAQLLQAGAIADDTERTRAVDRIEREGERMTALVDDLLVLARLDEERPLVLTDVDVTALAFDAVDDAHAVQRDRAFTVVAPDVVRVTADETGLRQVLTNLVANAVRHTPAGTRIEVRVSATPEHGARIDVIDDGPGIAPDDREHVFERFWHRDDATASERGTGLGLAIVAAITSAHGGHAELVDDGTPGAHFVVTLPPVPPAT